MYSNVKRTKDYKNQMQDHIKNFFGIDAVSLIPAKRGFYGETWRLDTVDASFFLKLVYAAEHIESYKRSFSVLAHLCDHGIDFISRIIKAKGGRLYTEFDDAILGVFDWIDGELTETDETKIPEYRMLAKVYTVPTDGVCIPREDFSGRFTDIFFERWKSLDDTPLLALLKKNREKIEHRAKRLKHFANLCRNGETSFFITHGDAGGNLIVNNGSYFLVDWDNPLLAPPERDAWVMCSRDWAREAFQTALHDNGISHTLSPERLAFYGYDFFFYYLNAFLDASADAKAVREYFNGWIEDSFKYFDKL